jgi:manganese/zinc/iron transport system permease protein
MFLYGQVATMTQPHIWMYTGLTLIVIAIIVFCYRLIVLVLFDKGFSKVLHVPVRLVETTLFFLLVLAIVIGIRSVGVVLMSGMLIAPSVAARQWSDQLSKIFVLSAVFGVVSGFLGNYLSLEIPLWFEVERFSLPTGPMILLSAIFFALFSLFFSPKRGVVLRLLRIAKFRLKCKEENLLKLLWKLQTEKGLSRKELQEKSGLSHMYTVFILWYLKRQGWLQRTCSKYDLTNDGIQRAARVVRLHRLWEAYLVYLGQGVEKVHRSAEEMEHIITPETEAELTDLLNDPKQDPHLQPIPEKGVIL